MPKDTKPEEIEIKRVDFNTDEQMRAAFRLGRAWQDGPAEFKELEEEYDDISRSTYQKTYKMYFGVPGDDRTISELRDEYGGMTEFLDRRDRGLLEDEKEDGEKPGATWEDLEWWREGFADGWQAASETLS